MPLNVQSTSNCYWFGPDLRSTFYSFVQVFQLELTDPERANPAEKNLAAHCPAAGRLNWGDRPNATHPG